MVIYFRRAAGLPALKVATTPSIVVRIARLDPRRVVRHPGQHVRNSRTAFASLRGKPFPTYAIRSGRDVDRHGASSRRLLIMLMILLFVPADYAGPCFIGFAIGESLGASALRIAGGIFTKIADIGSDLMKIVFNIKEDDARNPGVIADCTGDKRGRLGGPVGQRLRAAG